jgi:SAM-dependent methyltransferase
VLASAAARRASTGTVTGLDINDEMLAVARRKSSRIDWRLGRAEALPFPDASFDRVVSQFGLMFFEDKPTALREMWRVLRPNGRLSVAVWDALDHSAGYAVLAELLQRLFGIAIAEAFRAPFVLGDVSALRALLAQAEIPGADIRRVDGSVHFSSIAGLVSAEHACAWTLGGLLDDAQFGRLRAAAEESLRPFVLEDGGISFVLPALIMSAQKPRSS